MHSLVHHPCSREIGTNAIPGIKRCRVKHDGAPGGGSVNPILCFGNLSAAAAARMSLIRWVKGLYRAPGRKEHSKPSSRELSLSPISPSQN